MSYQTETNWMDELDSKLRNLEELEAARAKEAWEKHVVSHHHRYTSKSGCLVVGLGGHTHPEGSSNSSMTDKTIVIQSEEEGKRRRIVYLVTNCYSL